jgi:hypothetical protein
VLIVLGSAALVRLAVAGVTFLPGGGMHIGIAPIDILGVVLVAIGVKLWLDASRPTSPTPPPFPPPPEPSRSDAGGPHV